MKRVFPTVLHNIIAYLALALRVQSTPQTLSFKYTFCVGLRLSAHARIYGNICKHILALTKF